MAESSISASLGCSYKKETTHKRQEWEAMLDNRSGASLRVDSSSDEQCSISDMARIYGVSLRTLRFYEDRGLLAPQRQGTARFYNAANRIRLELILKGKRLGFTLAEIQDLIASHFKNGQVRSGTADKTDLTIGLNDQQIEAQIAHLERQRGELDQALAELRAALGKLKPCESARPASSEHAGAARP